MMKLASLLALVLLLVAGSILAEQPTEVKVNRDLSIPSFVGYVPNEFILKFKPNAGSMTLRRSSQGTVSLGVSEFDAVSTEYAVSGLRAQFPGADTDPYGAEFSRYYVAKIETGDLQAAMEAFRKLPIIESVEPIAIHTVMATPNDGTYPSQWHLNRANDQDMDAPEAWNIETGKTNIIVAILDTGVRYYHKDLGGSGASSTNPTGADGNMWINWAEKNGTAGVDDDGNGYVDDWVGYDFVTGITSGCWSGEDCTTADNDPRDFNGHGTHCAGNVGAMNNNGYATCSPSGGWGAGTNTPTGNGVKVMALRIGYSGSYLGQEVGYVRMDFAASAFYYAARNGAKIASCSWGSSNTSGLGAAIDTFLNRGGIIFKAAGNDGTQTADYMCGRTDIVSVAALDTNGCKADFSTYGTWVDISAPGTGIVSSYHYHADAANDYVATLDGTSMATPLAASVAALIWSKNPTWTAAQVKTQLFASADTISTLSCNSSYAGRLGSGRVNAYRAVNTGTPCAVTANFTGTPTTGCAPLNVSFTDASTGSPTSWSWTFGDGGTSTAQNPSYSYAAAGTYTVTLTVGNGTCQNTLTRTNYVTVSAVPVAAFTGAPTSGTAPLAVTFTNQSTGNPTSYSWNFGDGGTSTAASPTYSYATPGTYTVTLTATNSCGSDQEIKTNYITVSAATWVTITSDNFETGMGTYTDGGADMARYTGTNSHQGSYSADIQDNSGTASSFYHTSTYNVTAYQRLEVDFWFRGVSMESGEDFWVQYYNGTTWQTVATYAFGTTYLNNTFYHVVVSIPRTTYTFPTNARIRFMCDASDNNDDVYIDEIIFRGSASASAFSSGGAEESVASNGGILPESMELSQNYPNPFNPSTTIDFSLPTAGQVSLEVYNILGVKVATLVNGALTAGRHSVVWNSTTDGGEPVSSGVYFYRLVTEDQVLSRKMMLLK